VLLSFEGEPIANDGTVRFRKHERVAFSWLVAQKFYGEPARLQVLRDGKVVDIEIGDFHPEAPIVPVHLFNVKHQGPSYIIVAGLVFTNLSVPFLRSEFGEEWDCEAPVELVHSVMYQRAQAPGESIVVLTQLLAHDLTVGYEDLENVVLFTINGEKVRNLHHTKELIDGCESNFLRFGLQSNLMLILKTELARKATDEVLAQHGIPSAMSPDLAASDSAAAAESVTAAPAAEAAAADAKADSDGENAD